MSVKDTNDIDFKTTGIWYSIVVKTTPHLDKIASKVSILCLSFNQKDYIEQALESMLSQRTDFNFEILINDDASTDGTSEIIKEYQKKYPGIIKPTFQKENQYSQGKRNFILRYLIPKARGRYLAVCDGDDYWTDINKLQKQVDFLDSHKDYSLCFHPVRVIFENSEEPDSIYPESSDKHGFNITNLLKTNFIQTNSVMYRRQEYKNMNLGVMPGDWYLHLYHAQFGKIGFINKVMSVYRRHPGGIWWDSYNNIDELLKKHGIGHMNLYMELLRIYGDTSEYRYIIDNHIAGTVSVINRIDDTHKTKIMQTYTDGFSEQSKPLLISLVRLIYKNSKLHDKLNEDLGVAEKKLQDATDKKEKLEQEKEAILNARVYKAGLLMTTPYRTIHKLFKGVGKNE